jgi:hypothetical protein
LTLDELLGIYHDPGLQILDHRRDYQAERVPYQLWRNTVFAEWMARADRPHTKDFHVNLVGEESETTSAEEFRNLLKPAFDDRFQRWSREGISQIVSSQSKRHTLDAVSANEDGGALPEFSVEMMPGWPP